MSASRITWANKISGGNPKITHEEQWWFEDANEVKSTINNHSDLLDQFTFSNPLDGNVFLAGDFGVGGASTGAKLFAKATAGGQKLLELETFAGVLTLQADNNGNVWNRGLTGNVESTSFGIGSGLNNTGLSYTGYGWGSLNGNGGDRTVGVGVSAVGASNLGDDVVGVGYNALAGNLKNNNTAVGSFAAYEVGSGLNGADNTFLGFNCSYGIYTNITNASGVGANVTLFQSNSVVLGNQNVTDLFVGGNGAGINLKSPDGTTWRISVDNTGTLLVA